jgi:hypothetical protein
LEKCTLIDVSEVRASTEGFSTPPTSVSNLYAMKINITNRFTAQGTEFYEWDLWDGPADSSDHAHGYATDLVHAFSKILEWRERIANDYADLFTDTEQAG